MGEHRAGQRQREGVPVGKSFTEVFEGRSGRGRVSWLRIG